MRGTSFRWASVGFVFAFLLASTLAMSQTVNGSFRGTVRDESGAAIPGAAVKLTNAGTGVTRETVTDAVGDYVLPNIAPSVYDFTVVYKGFQTFTTKGVTLLVNQNATLDFVLKPGSVTQEMTV